MSRKLDFALGRGFALLLATLACSCDSTSSRNCLAGAEGCVCKADKTCGQGLVCLSKVCVSEGTSLVDGGVGGSGTVGGSGGKSNLGGTNGTTGGSRNTSSNGGTTALGQGGTPNTGGNLPFTTGGSADATGGSPVMTGGAPNATGGASMSTGGAAFTTGGTGTSLYPNQIANGDFSQGTTYWNVTNAAGSLLTSGTIVSGAYCIAASTATTQYVGWPTASTDAAYLQPGGTYVLSFRIKADAASVSVKAGEAVSPWTAVYQGLSMTVPVNWQSFSYSFPAGTSSFGVGVVFEVSLTSGTFCLDDVSLALVSS